MFELDLKDTMGSVGVMQGKREAALKQSTS